MWFLTAHISFQSRASLCPTTALSKYFLETSFVNTRIPYNIFYKTFDCVRLSYHPIMLPERMFLGNSGDSCLIISSKKSTIIQRKWLHRQLKNVLIYILLILYLFKYISIMGFQCMLDFSAIQRMATRSMMLLMLSLES